MSAFTYDCVALLNQIIQFLGGKGFSDTKTSAFKNEIQMALNEIWHAAYWSWRRQTQTMTVDSSTTSFTLPEDWDAFVTSEFHETTSRRRVRRVTDRDYGRAVVQADVGEPDYYNVQWSVTGSTNRYVVHFVPTPDGSYSYANADYWKAAPKLTFNASTGTTPAMPTEFHGLWAVRAKQKCASIAGEHKLAQAFEEEADRLLADARKRWDSDNPTGPPAPLESAYGDGAYLQTG
jgi:hypothetical protein